MGMTISENSAASVLAATSKRFKSFMEGGDYVPYERPIPRIAPPPEYASDKYHFKHAFPGWFNLWSL